MIESTRYTSQMISNNWKCCVTLMNVERWRRNEQRKKCSKTVLCWVFVQLRWIILMVKIQIFLLIRLTVSLSSTSIDANARAKTTSRSPDKIEVNEKYLWYFYVIMQFFIYLFHRKFFFVSFSLTFCLSFCIIVLCIKYKLANGFEYLWGQGVSVHTLNAR